MDKKIILTRRFQKHFDNQVEYLIKEWSTNSAIKFIEKVHAKIAFIKKNPSIGKPSLYVKDVRSVPVKPFNRIYYTEGNSAIHILH